MSVRVDLYRCLLTPVASGSYCLIMESVPLRRGLVLAALAAVIVWLTLVQNNLAQSSPQPSLPRTDATEIANPEINYPQFLADAKSVELLRRERRVTPEHFMEMAAESNT